MKLLLTLPYTVKDSALLKNALAWMRELQPNGYHPHSCLLAADETVPYDDRIALRNFARPLFAHTESIIVKVPVEQQRWPQAPNIMFATVARQIAECYRLPWLWFEPDAVPVKSGWLHSIALAYGYCPKRFMGSLVPSDGQPDLPPVHLAGCAVYDAGAYADLQPFTGTGKAWDIAAAGYSVPRAMNCEGMQHYWGRQDLPPSFKETPTAIDPPHVLPLSFIKSTTVMFHRCKDGSLIDLLRQKAQSRLVNRQSSQSVPVPALTMSEAVLSP